MSLVDNYRKGSSDTNALVSLHLSTLGRLDISFPTPAKHKGDPSTLFPKVLQHPDLSEELMHFPALKGFVWRNPFLLGRALGKSNLQWPLGKSQPSNQKALNQKPTCEVHLSTLSWPTAISFTSGTLSFNIHPGYHLTLRLLVQRDWDWPGGRKKSGGIKKYPAHGWKVCKESTEHRLPIVSKGKFMHRLWVQLLH